MTTTPPPAGCDRPTLILIIPQAALDTMPAATMAGIRGCEAQYHAGRYYVTVPAEVYAAWPKEPNP